MNSEWTVTIQYKNENLETVVEKEYDLITYTEMLHLALMRSVADIEEAFYFVSGGKQKEDWPPELKMRFKTIRHKLLDEANSIRRLPANLTYKGHKADQISIGDFIDRELT